MKLQMGCRLGTLKQEETMDIDDEDVEGMTEEEREAFFQQCLDMFVQNHFDSWCSVVEE